MAGNRCDALRGDGRHATTAGQPVAGEPGTMTTRERSVSQPTLAGSAAVALVATLIAFYMVSQFLRNSVGVIAPNLVAELDLTAAEVGLLSSAFFFAFAAIQLPLGVALDRFGPRLCLLVCAGITVAGALVFASATSPAGLITARALLGLGSSSSFMAALAVYARRFPPDRFATLTGLQIGIGSIGTLLATAPLAFATAAIGWRGSFLVVAALTLVAGVLVAIIVKDDGPTPGAAAARIESMRESIAGILEVLRTPGIVSLFLMHCMSYSSFALVVGLWGAPYLTHVYGYGLAERGDILLLAAIAQIVGSLLWGPTDRLFASYKRPVFLGSALTAAAFALIAAAGVLPPALLIVWFVVFGLVCGYPPVLVAHGKSVFPPHLVGRGITLLNMGTMGGVFLTQSMSGLVIGLFPPAAGSAYPLSAYCVVFALQGVLILLACLTYFRVRDPRREPG
jgi:MFS family permease